MSLAVLKYVGLGLTGLVGIGAAIVFGMHSSSSSSNLSETDRQWQFLHELSKKFFDASKKHFPGTDQKDNVIQWLKDKFSGSIENTEDKWENFKSLCEAQKAKETKSGKDVDNEYSRLCFVDEAETYSSKGYLFNWYGKSNLFPHVIDINVQNLTKINWDLWNEFNKKYPSSNPSDKFAEWYDNAEQIKDVSSKTFGYTSSGGYTGIQTFKEIMKTISSTRVSSS